MGEKLRLEVGRPKKQGTKESWEGLGNDHGDQARHCHSVTRSEGKNQAGSKFRVDFNSSGQPRSFPQGNGKLRSKSSRDPSRGFFWEIRGQHQNRKWVMSPIQKWNHQRWDQHGKCKISKPILQQVFQNVLFCFLSSFLGVLRVKRDSSQPRLSEVTKIQSQNRKVLGFRKLSFTAKKSRGSPLNCLWRMGPACVLHAFTNEEKGKHKTVIQETVVTDLCWRDYGNCHLISQHQHAHHRFLYQ